MNENDNAFATAAIQRGFITVAKIEEAKEVQRKLAEAGINESLSDILVKRNFLTKAQVDALTTGDKDGGKATIPGYKVLSKIGKGGMGTVYKATQLSIGRTVAIKVLSTQLSKEDPSYMERFHREAKNLAMLNHVNIVSAIDAGKVGAILYYVMEFVEGESVGDILKKRKKIPEQEALHIAIQVARALDHAHEHGIIHRDIKPDNILITKEGIAKVSDLGLAKSKGEDANLTQTGIAIGTPNYISPEQARGERDMDTRADIYSLGATLYHMVVGDPPFRGSSALEVVTKHLTEQLPPPRRLNPQVSEGLSLVIEKMLAKRKEDRYQNPKELLGDLELVIDDKMPNIRRTAAARGAVPVRTPAETTKARTKLSRPIPAMPKKQTNLAVPIGAGAAALLLIIVIVIASSGGKGKQEHQRQDPVQPIVKFPDNSAVAEKPTPPPPTPAVKEPETPKPVYVPPTPPPQPPPESREPWREELAQIERDVTRLLNSGEYAKANNELEKISALAKRYPAMKETKGQELASALAKEAGENLDLELENARKKLQACSTADDYTQLKSSLQTYKNRQLPKHGSKIDSIIVEADAKLAEHKRKEEELRKAEESRQKELAAFKQLLKTRYAKDVLPLVKKWDFKAAAAKLEEIKGEGKSDEMKKEVDLLVGDMTKLDQFIGDLWGQKKITVDKKTIDLRSDQNGRYVSVGGKKEYIGREAEKSAEYLGQIVRAKYKDFPATIDAETREKIALFYAYDGDKESALKVAGENGALNDRVGAIYRDGTNLPSTGKHDLLAFFAAPEPAVAGGANEPQKSPAEPALKGKKIDLISRGNFSKTAEGKEFQNQIEDDSIEFGQYIGLVKEGKFGELRNAKKVYRYDNDLVSVVSRSSFDRQSSPQRLFVGSSDAKDSSLALRGRILSADGFEIWLRADEKSETGVALHITPTIEVDPDKEDILEKLRKAQQGEVDCKFEVRVDFVSNGSVVESLGEESVNFGMFNIKELHTIEVAVKQEEIDLAIDGKPLLKRFRMKGSKLPQKGKIGLKVPSYPPGVAHDLIKKGRIDELLDTFGMQIRDLSYQQK